MVIELFQKLHLLIYASQFMTSKINSTFICTSEYGKCGKEGGKNTKIGISQERKELFRWNKKRFS